MGFYDTRCMVTGLNLRVMDTTLVLLSAGPDGYRPISLGLHGTENGYGVVDGVERDANADAVLGYFRERIRDGRARLADGARRVVADQPDTYPANIDTLLFFAERNNLVEFGQDDPALTLDGRLVRFAMIATVVWDALVAAAVARPEPVEERFAALFAGAPVADEIYRGRLAGVAGEVRAMDAVAGFLAARGQAWAPPSEPAQPYPTDVGMLYGRTEFLAEARRDHADDPVLGAALDAYEAQWRGELAEEYRILADQ